MDDPVYDLHRSPNNIYAAVRALPRCWKYIKLHFELYMKLVGCSPMINTTKPEAASAPSHASKFTKMALDQKAQKKRQVEIPNKHVKLT